MKRCGVNLAFSCVGTTAIDLMAASTFGPLMRSTPVALLLASNHVWNCDRVGLVDRSVHHLRLRQTTPGAEQDPSKSKCSLLVDGGICPSFPFDAPRSPSRPDLNGRGCVRPNMLSPSIHSLNLPRVPSIAIPYMSD